MNLAQLEQVALAAGVIDHNECPEWLTEEDLRGVIQYPKNARHIAAFSPDVALALIAVCRAAKGVGYSNGFDTAYPDKLASLRSALAALEAMEQP